MRRILPKDVVALLEQEFPANLNLKSNPQLANQEGYRAHTILPGILNMIENIPEELLIVESMARLKFTLATAVLKAQLAQTAPGTPLGWPMLSDNTKCLGLIWEILKACPNEAPSQSTKGLRFLTDAPTRDA